MGFGLLGALFLYSSPSIAQVIDHRIYSTSEGTPIYGCTAISSQEGIVQRFLFVKNTDEVPEFFRNSAKPQSNLIVLREITQGNVHHYTSILLHDSSQDSHLPYGTIMASTSQNNDFQILMEKDRNGAIIAFLIPLNAQGVRHHNHLVRMDCHADTKAVERIFAEILRNSAETSPAKNIQTALNQIKESIAVSPYADPILGCYGEDTVGTKKTRVMVLRDSKRVPTEAGHGANGGSSIITLIGEEDELPYSTVHQLNVGYLNSENGTEITPPEDAYFHATSGKIPMSSDYFPQYQFQFYLTSEGAFFTETIDHTRAETRHYTLQCTSDYSQFDRWIKRTLEFRPKL